MEVLVLAVLLGLIPAAIAKQKGHSFGNWWLFGSLLWIVALPWALLLKPNQAALDHAAIDAGGAKKCPSCAEMIKAEALVCRYCGREQSAETSASAGPWS